jgi:hypothetical protein
MPPAQPYYRPPLSRAPHRRRHRLAAALVALIVVVAAVAALLLLTSQPTSAPSSTPLRVTDVRLAVQPGTDGSCGTVFTFTATGSVSGTGPLTYQWVKSTAGSTPVYNRYTVTISHSQDSFRFTTPLQLTGQATVQSTVTFQILTPRHRRRRRPSTTPALTEGIRAVSRHGVPRGIGRGNRGRILSPGGGVPTTACVPNPAAQRQPTTVSAPRPGLPPAVIRDHLCQPRRTRARGRP